VRKHGAHPRQALAAPQHSLALWGHRQPFSRRINEHESDDLLRMTRGIGPNHEAAE
jgi:hypothetical protein